MLKGIDNFLYDRKILIGRPNLTLKNIKCGNIACSKNDKFKKYKENIYLCECGYHIEGEFEIEETHKVRLYCTQGQCSFGKEKMDKSCLSCTFLGER